MERPGSSSDFSSSLRFRQAAFGLRFRSANEKHRKTLISITKITKCKQMLNKDHRFLLN